MSRVKARRGHCPPGSRKGSSDGGLAGLSLELIKSTRRGFSGGLVVKILHFHCIRHGFNPWSGNEDPT